MDPAKMVEQTRDEVARRARDLMAWRYQIAVLVAAVGFGVLALLARTVLYFPVDLQVTRAVQGHSPPWLDWLLEAVTWIGFPPQSNVIFGLVILGLFLAGRRFEAISNFRCSSVIRSASAGETFGSSSIVAIFCDFRKSGP